MLIKNMFQKILLAALFLSLTSCEFMEAHYGPFEVIVEADDPNAKGFLVSLFHAGGGGHGGSYIHYDEKKELSANKSVIFPRGSFGFSAHPISVYVYHPLYWLEDIEIDLYNQGSEPIKIRVKMIPFEKVTADEISRSVAEFKKNYQGDKVDFQEALAKEREERRYQIIDHHLKRMKHSYFRYFIKKNNEAPLKANIKFLTELYNEITYENRNKRMPDLSESTVYEELSGGARL